MKQLLFAMIAVLALCSPITAQCPSDPFSPSDRWQRRLDEFDRRQEYRREWYRSPFDFDSRWEEYRRREEFRRQQYERLYPPYRLQLNYDTMSGQMYYTFVPAYCW